MSHNPTYDPEPGYDQSSYNPYAEQGRNSPQPQDFSNMASYRQAVGAPPGGLGAPDNGKSYRYATEAIPEDEEEGGDGHVRFTNGGQPTKTYSSPSDSKSSQSFWSRYGLYIMIALAILFAILFFIFLGLYVRGQSDQTRAPDGKAAAVVGEEPTTTVTTATPSQISTSPATTTTAEPEMGTKIGVYKGSDVMKFTLTNSGGMEVELLSLGARLNAMTLNSRDYVLGFKTGAGANVSDIAQYIYGSANGRICGDIGGTVTIGGQQYTLVPADGETKFSEGGKKGFYQMNFSGEKRGQTVTFKTSVVANSDDLPGSIDVTVMYTLDENANKLTVSMMATPTNNQDSLIDMCNSVRFNLNGDGSDVTPHQLMVNANKYHQTSQAAWTDITGGAMDFRASTALKPKIDALTSPDVNPNLKLYQYAYQILGASGMKMAGRITSGSRSVTIHTNQEVARISVNLDTSLSVPGKAAQPYGAKSGLSFITHADPYSTGTDHMLLKTGSTYKSEVSYTLA